MAEEAPQLLAEENISAEPVVASDIPPSTDNTAPNAQKSSIESPIESSPVKPATDQIEGATNVANTETSEEKTAVVEKEENIISDAHQNAPDSLSPNTELVSHDSASPQPSAAMSAFKGVVTEVKLLTKAWTGQIEESEDDPVVLDAFQRLDAYKEQLQALLKSGEKWVESMEKQLSDQQELVQQTHETHTVIENINPLGEEAREENTADLQYGNPEIIVPTDAVPTKTDTTDDISMPDITDTTPITAKLSNENMNETPADDAAEKATNETQAVDEKEETAYHLKLSEITSQESIELDSGFSSTLIQSDKDIKPPTFSSICKDIYQLLQENHQSMEKQLKEARLYFVDPIRNVLSREVEHALDVRKKYLKNKRQFDDCCTTMKKYQDSIEELDNPKAEEAAGSTADKFKSTFSRMFQSSPSKPDLETKLEAAQKEVSFLSKSFDTSKTQLLESIGIVEQKLNIEIVYYVRQFRDFVESWPRASIGASVPDQVRPEQEL